MATISAQPRRLQAAGHLVDTLLLTRRSVRATLRVPAAFLPSLAISVFFLFVYDAGLGNISKLPGFGGNYLGFILPVAIVSAAVSGAGSAGQSLVRDLESRYLYKLLLTPASRAAIVLGPIIAGALELGAQVVIITVLGLALGLRPATGLLGLLVVLLLALLWGVAFAGYAAGVALRTRNAQAAQAATFAFFPLIFLSTTFVPKELLAAEWLKVAATINPTTYVLDAMRALLLHGWQARPVLAGFVASVLFALLTSIFATLSARRVLSRS
jgi:ABC-2 type transport system permease protein